jgi:predicted nucleic acid-binding protein
MSAKAFLDTNILVYTFDGLDLAKRETARTMVGSALRDRTAIISYQVIQEFLNVATRKFATPLTEADSALYLKQVLNPLCEVHSSIDLYEDALDIQERWKYGFYDSLILAASLAGECDLLFTEDLQHGQKIRDITIINPFLDM